LIFDLDGTLLNTLPALASTHNTMLKSLGFPTHQEGDYRYFIGNGAQKCVERCLPPNSRSKQQIIEGVRIQQALYETNWQQDTVPYSGILDFLSSCTERHIPLAILSNKDDHFTQMIVSASFPDNLFKLALGHREGIPHKPDPTGALMIAEQLSLAPEQLALIGDSAMDMETALACNMLPVGVSWGFRTTTELAESGAAIIVDMPAELNGLIQEHK